MGLSRREFLQLMGHLVGGWALALPGTGAARGLARFLGAPEGIRKWVALDDSSRRETLNGGGNQAAYGLEPGFKWEVQTESERVLEKAGSFPAASSRPVVFDESKYAPLKRPLERAEWRATNRHLPIRLDPQVINPPGQRSPAAIERAVAYVPFNSARYVSRPGERVSMCNIAAWDWSRALQVHLPHWMGDTEMSANMLYRWIAHPQAGGMRGEGWQPVPAGAAQYLANLGVPVFALVENPTPGRHGHVALVYPTYPVVRSAGGEIEPRFATVTNGRRGRNGIKPLRSTFRWLRPTYFVHKNDFIVHLDAA